MSAGLTLFVKRRDGASFDGAETITVELSPESSVHEVKKVIAAQTGWAWEDQRLFFNGEALVDANQLSVYNFPARTTLMWDGPCKVQISMLSGKTITVYANPCSMVLDLISKISKVEGIESRRQQLVYEGAQLETWRPLSDYSITEGSTLNLVVLPVPEHGPCEDFDPNVYSDYDEMYDDDWADVADHFSDPDPGMMFDQDDEPGDFFDDQAEMAADDLYPSNVFADGDWCAEDLYDFVGDAVAEDMDDYADPWAGMDSPADNEEGLAAENAGRVVPEPTAVPEPASAGGT